MANHTIVAPLNDTNQENVVPSADPLANVRSTVREVLTAHIDRSAKGKRRAGTYAPRVAQPSVSVFRCQCCQGTRTTSESLGISSKRIALFQQISAGRKTRST